MDLIDHRIHFCIRKCGGDKNDMSHCFSKWIIENSKGSSQSGELQRKWASDSLPVWCPNDLEFIFSEEKFEKELFG
jgi:hypothetical protein